MFIIGFYISSYLVNSSLKNLKQKYAETSRQMHTVHTDVWCAYTEVKQCESVDLQDRSSALVVLPLALRPERPLLTFRDFPSERLPEEAETLAIRPRSGTDSSRSWQPFKHTSNRPEKQEEHFIDQFSLSKFKWQTVICLREKKQMF